MLDLLELTEIMVKSLVRDTESVQISSEVDLDTLQILVKVNEQDIGRLIGKDGRIIHSIRTLIQEASSLRNNQQVIVKVEKF